MARENGERTGGWGADIEGADHSVHARCRNDRLAILIPVVCEGFGWGDLGWEHGRGLGGSVEGEGENEVVGGGGWGTQVEEAEVGVGGYAGDEGGGVRGERGGVGAGVGWESEEGGWAGRGPLGGVSGVVAFGGGGVGTYNFDGTIPRARTESVFGHEVPVNGKDFALVLLP